MSIAHKNEREQLVTYVVQQAFASESFIVVALVIAEARMSSKVARYRY